MERTEIMTMQVLKLQLDNAQHKSIGQPLSVICKKRWVDWFLCRLPCLNAITKLDEFQVDDLLDVYQQYNIVYLGPGHWILAGWQVGMEGIRISSKLRK